MSALLKLVSDGRAVADVPAALGADPWAAATAEQRRRAEVVAALVAPLADLVASGASVNSVLDLFGQRVDAGMLDPALRSACDQLGGAPSRSTLKRWIGEYRGNGRAGLLPAYTGRVRQDYGWELRAAALFNQPSKPGYADVAWMLRREGFETATESRVKRYLKALPATLGPMSPARIGPHLHKLTRQRYQRRSTDELQVGEIYAGDGHTVDCYVAHPNTGKPFRPELTAFIDIKSRFIAGYWFTESESAQSTLFALSSAMVRHDHVPAWLYIDRGAGYRAKLLSDESTGWYGRFDIALIGAIPGNPHGKGWIERWFRTCRDKHDKFFAQGQVYCGDDMAPETNRRLSADLASGKRTLPAYRDYVESFARFIAQYHMEPMDVLRGRTPAQVWAELAQVPVGLDESAVMRPVHRATVMRQTVTLHHRTYYAEALALYDAQKVDIEYDLMDDRKVWVHDLKGRLIAIANLVKTIGVLPTSRLEEQRDKRLAGQVKRLQKHAAEAIARRADPITADAQAAGLAELEAAPAAPAIPSPPAALPAPQPAADAPASGDDIEIDLLTWRPQ